MVNHEYKKFRNSVTMVFFVLAMILLIVTIFLVVKSYLEKQNGVAVMANVEEVNFVDDQYIIKVNYSVENKVYEQTIESKQEVTVTDLYEIRYDKDNPNELIDSDYTIAIAITSSITLVSLAISLEEFISFVVNKNKKERLFKEGLKVNANIIEIYVNNKAYRFKNKLPYKIRLEYLNPQDNKKYVFESENIYEDMQYIIESKRITSLPVYINSKNTYEYYIDLNSI